MKDWLASRIDTVIADVLCAYIYGSALQPMHEPRDVDIIVVTRSDAGSACWARVRTFCEHMREEFIDTFGLPLSVMIATPSEWSEIDGVVVRERLALS